MAQGLKLAYKDVYERNEYAHELPKDKFKNLIVEMTGVAANDSSAGATVSTFSNLKSFANFDAKPAVIKEKPDQLSRIAESSENTTEMMRAQMSSGNELKLSYTINLNLPETTDVEVFNAIFRSLKENLL